MGSIATARIGSASAAANQNRRVISRSSLSSSGPAPVGFTNTGSRTFAVPWTLVGGPAFSLPLLQVSGLPCGVQLMGFEGGDAALFALARHLLESGRARQDAPA